MRKLFIIGLLIVVLLTGCSSRNVLLFSSCTTDLAGDWISTTGALLHFSDNDTVYAGKYGMPATDFKVYDYIIESDVISLISKNGEISSFIYNIDKENNVLTLSNDIVSLSYYGPSSYMREDIAYSLNVSKK